MVVVVCFSFWVPSLNAWSASLLVIGEAQGLYWFSTPFSFQFLFSAGFLFFALRYPPQLLRSDAVLAIDYELANSQECTEHFPSENESSFHQLRRQLSSVRSRVQELGLRGARHG